MALFNFLKKKAKIENNSVQENNGRPVIRDHANAILIGDQHISGSGMHISCAVWYFPWERVVECVTTSTSDTMPHYEILEVPAEINTAEGLILFIKSNGPWLLPNHTLSDECRQRIDATFNGKTQQGLGSNIDHPEQIMHVVIKCQKDMHNFIPVDATRYQCDKCGLEVQAPRFSRTILNEYFGSYFDGVSHKWNSVDMRAEDIVSFSASFGDRPIVTIKYDCSVLKIKNSINGSRDGWMSFPEGYFEEKTIPLSDKDKNKLNECLLSLDFETFITSQELFRNLGAPGFCISDVFRCQFSNGKGFECLLAKTNEFTKLVSVVKEIAGLKPKPVHEALSDKPATYGVKVSCCNRIVPDTAIYCPYCGKLIEDKADKCIVSCDDQATVWLCVECGSSNRFEYKFCSNCGVKRQW